MKCPICGNDPVEIQSTAGGNQVDKPFVLLHEVSDLRERPRRIPMSGASLGAIRKHTMESYEILRFDRRLKTIDFTMNFVVGMMVLDKIKGGVLSEDFWERQAH